VNDLIADLLTRIQNAVMRKKASVIVPYTRINTEILKVLKSEEMIKGFEENKEGREIEVELSYTEGKEPVVTHFEKVSKPGQRMYISNEEIIPILNGRGISILTTSSGVMTGAMAKGKGLGGEYICKIW
jgi:small subunit ribosomal protein S8